MRNFKDYISEGELTLVGFHANWCNSCRTMYSNLEEYKKEVGNTVRVLKIDIDSPANKDKTHEYRIESLPVYMFFHHGEKLWQGSGVISPAELIELSDKLLQHG